MNKFAILPCTFAMYIKECCAYTNQIIFQSKLHQFCFTQNKATHVFAKKRSMKKTEIREGVGVDVEVNKEDE